ncbi:hypothetical protein BBJ28_00002040 [Nothophytophthora sp. Chile5]|nr:hypothetical protein BBJ28_00002040 [Nothophytophthora sp. Chile5]
MSTTPSHPPANCKQLPALATASFRRVAPGAPKSNVRPGAFPLSVDALTLAAVVDAMLKLKVQRATVGRLVAQEPVDRLELRALLLNTGVDGSLVPEGVVDAIRARGTPVLLADIPARTLTPIGGKTFSVHRAVTYREVELATSAGPLMLKNLVCLVEDGNSSLDFTLGMPIVTVLRYSMDELLARACDTKSEWELGGTEKTEAGTERVMQHGYWQLPMSSNGAQVLAFKVSDCYLRLSRVPARVHAMAAENADNVERHETRTALPLLRLHDLSADFNTKLVRASPGTAGQLKPTVTRLDGSATALKRVVKNWRACRYFYLGLLVSHSVFASTTPPGPLLSLSLAAMAVDGEATAAPDAVAASDHASAAATDSAPPPPVVSSPPTFAFAAWTAELELLLQREGDTMRERVQALQSDFDDGSLYVRGDFAWRRQLAAFHDRLQDALTQQLDTLAATVSGHAAQVAQSLAQSLARAEREAQLAVQQQEHKGEAALRRARVALAKELERVTRLEKCLRHEEARQAAATSAERQRQLVEQHEARESHLQALLSDMHASSESLEAVNAQLLESLRTSRAEFEQLRNTLVHSMARPSRRSTSAPPAGTGRGGKNGSPTRSGDKLRKIGAAAAGLEPLPPGTSDLLLVPALRKALNASAQQEASLKKRVVELEATRESDRQRLQGLQQAATQAAEEKTRASVLLAEARAALEANETQLAQAASESSRWRGKCEALQAQVEGQERAIADSQRFEDAARGHAATLEKQVQRLTGLEAQRQELERLVAEWKEAQRQETPAEETEEGKSGSLERIVDAFLITRQSKASASILDTSQELEKRLRFEFERRFGEQLNLRVSHERRRVLERLECLCAEEAQEKQELLRAQQERARRLHQSIPRPATASSSGGALDFPRLQRLVIAAYEQLGICVGAWAATDLDALNAQLEALGAKVAELERDLEEAANRAEAQRVTLVRAELAQQEKELLLTELTSRYRQLRAAQQAWIAQQQQQEQQQQQREPFEREPLTVYGIPQPMGNKPKLHSLLLPSRARPASASPCLASTQQQQQQLSLQSKETRAAPLSPPPPSRLGSRLAANSSTSASLQHTQGKSGKQKSFAAKTRDPIHNQSPDEAQAEDAVEHVRSVLKSQLLLRETENQLEDTVGSDGVSDALPVFDSVPLRALTLLTYYRAAHLLFLSLTLFRPC